MSYFSDVKVHAVEIYSTILEFSDVKEESSKVTMYYLRLKI
jgi:hypothetical protein